MRAAGESQPSPASPAAAAAEIPAQFTGQASDTVDRTAASTNNAGTGSNPIGVNRTLHVISGTSGNSARETIEGSHQAAEQSNVLLEVCSQPVNRSDSRSLVEHFNQVLERLTQLVEKSRQPADQPNQLVECFNQLFDRFDQLVERFTQPAQKANEIAEQSNQIAEQANQLRSQANKPVEHLGDVMEDVNRVLVGIQHAIVRVSHSRYSLG
ncbi:hypothetical protein B0J17DRAFT_55845 [Rhizoctonia solani]|nr:hypothetical protein B0J17DRAFT_55845 [Rhizoctonia solani]